MHLGTALSALEHQAEGAGAAPAELRYSADRYLRARQAGDDDPQGSLFESTLADLQAWLADGTDRDRTAPEQVQQARASRAEAIQFAASKTRELQESLHQTQQAITQRAQSALTAISDALDTLNLKSGGLGARLDCEILPPGAPRPRLDNPGRPPVAQEPRRTASALRQRDQYGSGKTVLHPPSPCGTSRRPLPPRPRTDPRRTGRLTRGRTPPGGP